MRTSDRFNTDLYLETPDRCRGERNATKYAKKGSLKKVCVDFGRFVDLHFLDIPQPLVLVIKTLEVRDLYHFESIKFLLDLLGKQRGETITCRHVSPSIILAARPSIVELDSRAKRNISTGSRLWGAGGALARAGEAAGGEEVVFSLDGNRVGASVTRAWGTVTSGTAWSAAGALGFRALESWDRSKICCGADDGGGV